MKNFWHGLARLFTFPSSLRARIAANPLTAEVKQGLATELESAIAGAISKKVSDPAAQQVLSAALGHAIDMTGLLK